MTGRCRGERLGSLSRGMAEILEDCFDRMRFDFVYSVGVPSRLFARWIAVKDEREDCITNKRRQNPSTFTQSKDRPHIICAPTSVHPIAIPGSQVSYGAPKCPCLFPHACHVGLGLALHPQGHGAMPRLCTSVAPDR